MARRKIIAEVDPLDTTPSRPTTIGAPLKPSAGYMDSTTAGGGHRLSFANYQLTAGVTQPYVFSFSTIAERDRSLSASVASDLGQTNPTLSPAVDTLQVHAVGTGLTLSSKPDWRRLGITERQARDLAHDIETGFASYAGNPDAVDFTGRFDLHQLANTAFRQYLTIGEVFAVFGWEMSATSPFRTKLNLLNPFQLAPDITRREAGLNIWQGVCFDDAGRLIGFMVRESPLGSLVYNVMPRFIPVRTAWGRTNALHLFEQRDGRQIRGASPLMAATVAAQDRAFLGERVLASAALQSVYAATLESEMRPNEAALALGQADHPTAEDAIVADLAPRIEYYSHNRIGAEPGKVVVLPKGDKLKMNSPGSPNQTFHDFDKNLTRQAARAAGATFEDVSGDFSETSYSASRMATYTPSLTTARRRKDIVVPIYRETFNNWLEEAFANGTIQTPRGAPPFWVAREAYSRAEFLGSPPPEPDRLKAANAAKTELENGLTDLTTELAKRGIDFETYLENVKSEKDALGALGIVHPALRPTTTPDPIEPDQDDEQPKRKPQ